MHWEVRTDYVIDWIANLDPKTRDQVYAALELLAEQGPNLKRPLVGEIRQSRHKNMKELRPGSAKSSKIRILFIFDPERKAILLLAGDKSIGDKKWQKWYNQNIPIADKIYDKHLKTLNTTRKQK